MNERIRELAREAREYAESKMQLTGVKDSAAYDKKFAELIVKECIELNKQELAFNAFERMLNRYKEHFGVEE